MKFRRKHREEVGINLTPLIDVVFLLLIFFMVSTTFTRETQLSIDLPEAQGSVKEASDQQIESLVDEAGSYRVNLQVDERDIAGLAVGQSGELRLAAMPDRAIALDVTRIVPLATADQSGNRFRVEAELPSTAESLRPGMHGVAKVVTGESSMLHAWTAELLDRVKFWLWSLGF